MWGGDVSEVTKDENGTPEKLMIYLYKDPNPAKKEQSSAYGNMHVSINSSEKGVVDALEGIESNDKIYFYGYGEEMNILMKTYTVKNVLQKLLL